MQDIRSIVNARFGKAERVKVGKANYAHDMESSIIMGKTETVERILNMHRKEPFGTVDEIIGQLQLDLVDSWNEFHRKHRTRTAPITLETVLKQQEYIK